MSNTQLRQFLREALDAIGAKGEPRARIEKLVCAQRDEKAAILGRLETANGELEALKRDATTASWTVQELSQALESVRAELRQAKQLAEFKDQQVERFVRIVSRGVTSYDAFVTVARDHLKHGFKQESRRWYSSVDDLKAECDRAFKQKGTLIENGIRYLPPDRAIPHPYAFLMEFEERNGSYRCTGRVTVYHLVPKSNAHRPVILESKTDLLDPEAADLMAPFREGLEWLADDRQEGGL
jgi:hypothetical protein